MRVRLRTQKLDTPDLVAYDRILKRYGSNCYLQNIEEREDKWRVAVGAFLQSKVIDEKTERERVFSLNFKNVGEIFVRKATMKVALATPLRTLGKNIIQKKNYVRRLVEEDLIKILGREESQIKFSQLKFAFQGLQPIYRTMSRLLTQEYPTYEELKTIGPHYLEQVDLLIDLGYAEFNEQSTKLEATNKLKDLYAQKKNTDETIDVIFGLLLSNFYLDLQKGRRIAQFTPYVKASTAYYGDAIKFGELIRINEKRLGENIRLYYSSASARARQRYAYPTVIRELVDAQILEYDKQYITGKKEIFEGLKDIRSKLDFNERLFPFG